MRIRNWMMVLGTLLITTVSIQAQGQNSTVGAKPSTRPTVSPFVNLRRAGTPAKSC